MAKINNWSLIHMRNSEYDAPETRKVYFAGEVYGHSFFDDGERIVTSEIVGFKGNKFYTFSGTEYELGDVSIEYENKYPNAHERLMKSLE